MVFVDRVGCGDRVRAGFIGGRGPVSRAWPADIPKPGGSKRYWSTRLWYP